MSNAGHGSPATGETDDSSMRNEAQPFAWEILSADQQVAAAGICTQLARIEARATKFALAASTKGTAGRRRPLLDFAPPIDRTRESHVLLIDGARGSGKSAVLLTLLDEWGRRWRQAPTARGLRQKELDLTSTVVPVGLVDLEALPDETNLLLHLVGQFQRVVRALDLDGLARERAQPQSAPWEAPLEEPEVRRAWRDFLRAAALGGADGLRARRANVDPEAFVVELEETELHRIDIARAFRALIDALVVEFRDQKLLPDGGAPLFVIAIDDADMQPGLCLPALQLIRTFWHTNVAFLITGDSRLFRERIHGDIRGQLRQHAPDAKAMTRIEALEDDLVDQRYRKLIPPGQRYLLPPLPPKERFGRLETILGSVKAPQHPLRLQHMREYLEVITQAHEILPGNFRELLDLQQWLLQLSAPTDPVMPGTRADGIPAETLVWALNIRPHDYTEVRPLGKSLVNSQLRNDLGRLTNQPTRWILRDGFAPIENGGSLERLDFSIELACSPHLEAAPSNSPFAYTDSTKWLVEADIAGQWGIPEAIPELPPIIRTKGPQGAYGWPLPDWRSPLDLVAFWHLFDRIRERAAGPAATPEIITKRYLTAILDYDELRWQRKTQAGDAPLLNDLNDLSDTIAARAPTWSELAGRVAQCARRNPDFPINAWAIRGAGLLASPDFGLDASVADAWLRALIEALGDSWPTIRDALKTARDNFRRKTASFWSDEGTGVPIHDLNDLAYEWYLRVEEDDSKTRATAWENLARAASQFPVRAVEPHLGPVPKNLLRFLSIGRTYLQQEASPVLLLKWTELLREIGGGEGATALAVRELWNATKNWAPELPAVPEDLVPTTLMSLYQKIAAEPNSWRFVPEAREARLRPSVVARPGSFRWADDVTLRHPLARTVFEMAWDFVFDTSDSGALPDAGDRDRRLRWWLGGGGVAEGKILYPWPAVDWWSFSDHTILTRAWNRRVEQTKRLSNELSSHARLGDDLALWYVRLVGQVAEYRSAKTADVPWQTGAGKDAWLRQIAEMQGHRATHHESARWRCYEQWLDRLPLLAAPESGLSPTTAAWILEAFPLEDSQKQALQEERRLRLIEGMGDDPLLADDALARIDELNKEHPWMSRFSPFEPIPNDRAAKPNSTSRERAPKRKA